MTEHEIVEQMESIHALCARIADDMHVAQRKGRMMTIEETQRVDGRSQELRRRLAGIPRDPFDGMVSSELRQRMARILKETQTTLRSVIQPAATPANRKGRLPHAASNRLTAYGAY